MYLQPYLVVGIPSSERPRFDYDIIILINRTRVFVCCLFYYRTEFITRDAYQPARLRYYYLMHTRSLCEHFSARVMATLICAIVIRGNSISIRHKL